MGRARNVVSKIAALLYQELLRHGRLGACVDISGILSRILDREGIWNCPIKGSLTIEFPLSSALETSYFWSVDLGDFVAGHAWVFAPPFTVVDIIAFKQQSYSPSRLPFFTDMVLSEDHQAVSVEAADIVSPSARAEPLMHGTSPERLLDVSAPQLKDMLRVFPAIAVDGLRSSRLKYSPVAIGLPDKPLEEMRNMEFDGGKHRGNCTTRRFWKSLNETMPN